MAIIRLLVQNLIVIIVLAVFMEMFFPAGDMKRYVKLVTGLLVINAVLGALSNLSRGDWVLELPDQAISSEVPGVVRLEEIMASAKKISQGQQTRAREEYKGSLARQVSALAGLSGEVSVLSAEVDLYDEENNPKYGQVKEIRLVVKSSQPSGQGQNITPPPVEIKVGEKKQNEFEGIGQTQQYVEQALPATVKNRIKTTVANFYNLLPEQVCVTDEG